MSVSASIEISLNKPILPVQIIEMLLDFGWTFNDCGKISYLPIGDDGMFDWVIQEEISMNSLMEILKEKERLNELIGIVMTWENTNIGGSFLLQQDGNQSLNITINRKLLVDESDYQITDVNWYLTRLLPAFNQDNTYVEYYTYEEHR